MDPRLKFLGTKVDLTEGFIWKTRMILNLWKLEVPGFKVQSQISPEFCQCLDQSDSENMTYQATVCQTLNPAPNWKLRRLWQGHSYHQNLVDQNLGLPLKTSFRHGGKVCRVLGNSLPFGKIIFPQNSFVPRRHVCQKTRQRKVTKLCLEEEAENFPSQMLSSRLFVIHNAAGSRHYDVSGKQRMFVTLKVHLHLRISRAISH